MKNNFYLRQSMLFYKEWNKIMVISFSSLLVCSVVLAEGITSKLKTTADTAFGGSVPLASDTPQSLIAKALSIILSFLGIIFLCLMIYGGFKWMLARGNPKETDVARDLIRDAIIGLAIVVSAYAITVFIGGVLTG